MKEIEQFLERYGLSDSQVKVYLSCLQLGEASVLTLSKRARTKRPTTYLILEELQRKGLVDTFKTKRGLIYRALHPKKIGTQLKNLEQDFSKVLPEMMALHHDKDEKPVIGVYEDYDVYEQLADEVREHVLTGKEVLYFGNSEYFIKNKILERKWLNTMKHKRTKCREILCGLGKTQSEYKTRVEKLQNPNYQIKLFEPSHEVVTEFAVWGNTVVYFSGTGKDLFTIKVESEKLANMQKAIFEQLWASLT